jgi:hypothetical protein
MLPCSRLCLHRHQLRVAHRAFPEPTTLSRTNKDIQMGAVSVETAPLRAPSIPWIYRRLPYAARARLLCWVGGIAASCTSKVSTRGLRVASD